MLNASTRESVAQLKMEFLIVILSGNEAVAE